MSQRSTTAANSTAGDDGIIADDGVFTLQPLGVDPTGQTDLDQFMEEQW
jgi:hypothetical protein